MRSGSVLLLLLCGIAGADEVRVAVEGVCAWPNLTRLEDGTVVACIFNRPSHGQQEGDVECWMSKRGLSWRRRGTPARHERGTVRMNVAAGLTASGELIAIVSGWSSKTRPGQPNWHPKHRFRQAILAPWVCRSRDGGRRWSVARDAFPERAPDGGWCIPFGDIAPGADGALRVAVYSVKKGRGHRAYVYKSVEGQAWGDPVALDEKSDRNETALLHLGKGKWLAAARKNGDGLWLYASDDDARSWTARGRLTEGARQPAHLLRLRDGRILLAYGNRTSGKKAVEARLSPDGGKSWGKPRRLASFEGDGGYPSSVQREDGKVVTAFYARKTARHDGYHMGVVIWE